MENDLQQQIEQLKFKLKAADFDYQKQIAELQCNLLSQDKIIMTLENKLETAKEFINYCKSQPDVYVHANKCLTEIE